MPLTEKERESLRRRKARYRARHGERLRAQDRELYRAKLEAAKTDPVKAAALVAWKAKKAANTAANRAVQPEIIRQRGRDFYAVHKNDESLKEAARKRKREWHAKLRNDPERLKAFNARESARQRNQRRNHPEKIRAYERSPQIMLRSRARARIRNALKYGAARLASTTEALGCSIPELKAHIESLFQPGMTWENRGKWHVDHIRPCASFNLLDAAQYRACFHFSNLQPLWAADNIRKSDKWA